MIATKLLKLLLPNVIDHLVKSFKLDKVLRYVEEPNDLDLKVRRLDKRLKKLERK